MKRNISINIFGNLYHIDEDAYELLKKYNENMRRYYSNREDGEEIADDVEHRVAELFSELQSKGVLAITIEHVKEIIERIGDPQQMDDNDSAANSADDMQGKADEGTNEENASAQQAFSSDQQTENTRKLFRDPEDKVLGGVISGACHYFGISDPLIPRIVFVLLFLASYTTLALIYIIAWILIPEAISPEDRLRMQGKPVSAKAINEELMRGLNNANQFVSNKKNQDTARGCLTGIIKFFIFSVALFFIFILGLVLLSLILVIACLAIAFVFGGVEMIEEFGGKDITLFMNELPSGLIAVVIGSAFLSIGIPLFALIRMVFSRKDSNNMSTTAKVALIFLWVLSIGALIGSGIRAAQKAKIEVEKYDKKKHTRNGLYLPGEGWYILDRMGWEKVKIAGTEKHIGEWGQMPNGSYGWYLSLEAEDNAKDMDYNLSQQQDLLPGKYKIVADVRADGEGNALYVLTKNNQDTLRVDIPMFEKVENEISDEEVVVDSDDSRDEWTHIEKTFTVGKQEKVTFGVSNEDGFHVAPWNCREMEIAKVFVTQGEEVKTQQ